MTRHLSNPFHKTRGITTPMYAAIWRITPGPPWLKVLILFAIFLAVVGALFYWVFPAIAPYLPINQVSVE